MNRKISFLGLFVLVMCVFLSYSASGEDGLFEETVDLSSYVGKSVMLKVEDGTINKVEDSSGKDITNLFNKLTGNIFILNKLASTYGDYNFKITIKDNDEYPEYHPLEVMSGHLLNPYDFRGFSLKDGNYIEYENNSDGKHSSKLDLLSDQYYYFSIKGHKDLNITSPNGNTVFEQKLNDGELPEIGFLINTKESGTYTLTEENSNNINVSVYKIPNELEMDEFEIFTGEENQNYGKKKFVVRFNNELRNTLKFYSLIDNPKSTYEVGLRSHYFIKKTKDDSRNCPEYCVQKFYLPSLNTVAENLKSETVYYVSDNGNTDFILMEFDARNEYAKVGTDFIYHNSKTGKDIEHELIYENGDYSQLESLVEDPVDSATGAFVDSKTLLSYGGNNPLQFIVKYNSLLTSEGYLSNGWVHNYESELNDYGEYVEISWDPNNKMRFNLGEDGIYHYDHNKNKNIKLEKNSDGSYIFIDRDKSLYKFDNDGKLYENEDIKGIKTKYEYDEEGKLIKVYQPLNNHSFKFIYDINKKLNFVEDNLGNKVEFVYNYYGDLINIIDSENRNLKISYHSNGKVQGLTNNDGKTFVYNIYDDLGRVIRQTDGKSGVSYFEYDDYSFEDRVITKVTDRLGNVETLIHDDKFQLIEKINKSGNHKYFEYNEFGYQVAEVDYNGNRTEFKYDEKGNLLEELHEDGNKKLFEYDINGNLIKVVDEKGNETVSVYDDSNNLISVTDANGNITNYTYNELNLPLTIVDQKGNITSYEYDDNGLLISIVDKEGNTTSFENDSLGRVVKVILPEGNITQTVYDGNGNVIETIDHFGKSVTKTYNSWNKILTETDVLERITKFSYDGNGNITNKSIGNREWIYTYDKEDNLVNERNSMYANWSKKYDLEGRVIEEKDSENNYWTYQYDGNGNVLDKTLNGKYKTYYVYDEYDRVIKETDPEGKVTEYVYDLVGNVIEINLPNGSKFFTYDNVGNKLSETDENGNVINYEYDELNQLVKKIDAKDNVWSYEYNKNGLLIKEINPLGQSTSYSYDKNGNLIQTFNALGEVISTSEYDMLGRLISLTDGLGNKNRFEYDDVGNIIGVYDAKDIKIEERIYNEFNELVSVKDALGFISQNEYNKAGQIIKVIDELNRSQSYTVDRLGRITRVTDKLLNYSSQVFNDLGLLNYYQDPNSNRTTYLYNKIGQLLSETNHTGNKLSYVYNGKGWLEKYTNARGQETVYSYDSVGNVIKQVEDGRVVEFEYDNNYNITKVKEQDKGIISRVYDELDRVISYTDEYGNTIGYEYDQRGHLSKLIYPGNLVVTYEYDVVGNLKKVTDWHQKVTEYEYDVNNRLSKTIKPDGSKEIREYDSKGQLIKLSNISKDETVISEDIFTYDSIGNVITEGEESYGYDVLDRLLTTNKNTFTYDKTGNILTFKELVDGISNQDSFVYGKDNQLSKYNNITSSYDKDGNLLNIPVNGSLLNGIYDSRNRLTSVGNTSYGYNAENIRTSILVNGLETRFIIDPISNDLSRVLMETDSEGNPTKYYIYGIGLISSYDATNNVDILKVYHYDRRGSTIALTDVNSNVLGNVEYDTYGEILSKDEAIDTRFLYNGRQGVQTDSNGLYYMRARYYSPEIKRFINRDVVQGNIEESQTFNRYAYVNGNPVSYIDPFGLSRSLDGQLKGLRDMLDEALNDNWMMFPIKVTVGEDIVYGLDLLMGNERLVSWNTAFAFIPFNKQLGMDKLINTKSIKNSYSKPVAGDNIGNALRGVSGKNPDGSYNLKNGGRLIEISMKESMEMDKKNQKKPYANHRPPYAKGQVETVWENAKDQITGKVYDPNDGRELFWDKSKSRNGQWDMGHVPEAKYSEVHKKYMNDEMTLEAFLEYYRDVNNYKPEWPPNNRSHEFE